MLILALSVLTGAAQPDAARYDSSQSTEPLRQLEARVREAIASPKLRPAAEAELVLLLAPDSTLGAKRFACQQLAIIGGERSLPAMAPLLGGEATAGLVCLALSTYPPGKADALLRAALSAATGTARL